MILCAGNIPQIPFTLGGGIHRLLTKIINADPTSGLFLLSKVYLSNT